MPLCTYGLKPQKHWACVCPDIHLCLSVVACMVACHRFSHLCLCFRCEFVSYFLAVGTSVIDCLKRLVSKCVEQDVVLNWSPLALLTPYLYQPVVSSAWTRQQSSHSKRKTTLMSYSRVFRRCSCRASINWSAVQLSRTATQLTKFAAAGVKCFPSTIQVHCYVFCACFFASTDICDISRLDCSK